MRSAPVLGERAQTYVPVAVDVRVHGYVLAVKAHLYGKVRVHCLFCFFKNRQQKPGKNEARVSPTSGGSNGYLSGNLKKSLNSSPAYKVSSAPLIDTVNCFNRLSSWSGSSSQRVTPGGGLRVNATISRRTRFCE